MEAVDLGYIFKVLIRHDNALLNPSWFLDRIEIIDRSDNGRRFMFLCERWLSKSKDDKKIKRNLYEKSYEVWGKWEIQSDWFRCKVKFSSILESSVGAEGGGHLVREIPPGANAFWNWVSSSFSPCVLLPPHSFMRGTHLLISLERGSKDKRGWRRLQPGRSILYTYPLINIPNVT